MRAVVLLLCFQCSRDSLQVHRSSLRNLRSTLVGASTITLVVRDTALTRSTRTFDVIAPLHQVAFVCLLQNIVARSPLIFITLAEVVTHPPPYPTPAHAHAPAPAPATAANAIAAHATGQ